MGNPDAGNAADYGRQARAATILMARDRFRTAARKSARRVSALLREYGTAGAAWRLAPTTRAREREACREGDPGSAFPARFRRGTAPWIAARTRSGCSVIPREVRRA